MLFQLVKQIAEREGVTEQLKANNQMEWIARMNNIQSRATEIVNHNIERRQKEILAAVVLSSITHCEKFSKLI